MPNSTHNPAALTYQIALRCFRYSLAVLAFILAACAETPKVGVPLRRVEMPRWAKSGNHPDFPEATHIAAYGAAETPEAARTRADALLEVLIVRYALSLGEKQLEGTRFKQLVLGPASWISLPDLAEGVQRDGANDGFEAVHVAGIAMNELRFRAKALMPGAVQEMRAATEPAEIDDAAKRVSLWAAYFLPSAKVLALSLLAGDLDRFAHARAEMAALKLAEIAEKMEVQLGGANQTARLLGGLPQELSLTAMYRGRMPAGVKLVWSVEPPAGGVVSGFAEFNLTGQAFCNVLALAAAGNETAVVRCSADLDAMAGRRLGIVAPSWRWVQYVPARGNVLLSLDVRERFGTNPVKPVFTDACIQWSRLNELALLDDQSPNQRGRFRYHVALSGLIDVNVSKQGGVLVATASGQVQLKNVDTGDVIFRFNPTVVLEAGAESDVSELAQQAQRESAGDALLELGARLLALFPAPKP